MSRNRVGSGVPGGRAIGADEASLLQSVFNNATVAIFVMNHEQSCIYMNPAAESLTGYSVEEVRGRPLHDVVHHTRPDGTHYPLEECPIDRAFPKNLQERGEEVFVHRDGSFYPVAYAASPVREEGVVVGTILEVRDLSSEKTAERVIRQVEARFRTLVTTYSSIVWIADAQGGLQEATAWEAFTGQSPRESGGLGWLKCVHPDDRDRVRSSWTQAVADRAPVQLEYRLLHEATQTYRHVEVDAAPLTDEDGQVVEWVGTVSDIHEQKLAEIALSRSEQRARLAIEAAKLGTWTYDLESDTVLFDERMRSIWGEEKSAAVLPMDTVLGRVHPDDLRKVEEAIRTAIDPNSSGRYAIEYRILWRDGTVRWVSAAAQTRFEGTGSERRPLWVLGTALDVTDHKEAISELQRQAGVMRTLNHVAAALSSERDLQRLVQDVTDAGTKMSGAEFGAFFYNRVDEQGEAYTLYTLSGAPREAFEGYPMPRNTHVFGPTFRGEGVVRSDDITQDPRYGQNPPYYGKPRGHLPVVSYLAVPVISRSGEVLGGLFFGHARRGVFTKEVEETITALASHAAVAIDNARLYEQVQAQNQTLEQQVRQRTSDLQTLNAELEAFNYSVSHDLRAPLRAINGFSDALLQDYHGSLDETARSYLSRIGAGASRMGEIIDSLLDLSRLVRSKLDKSEVDLSEMALSIAGELHRQQPDRNVRVDISPGIVVRGDQQLLKIALENLLGNAWKFTRDKQDARVELGATSMDEKRVYYVRDNGAGFPPESADRVFMPFQRLHLDREFEGSGIGLATVQRIIRRHGGEIWASGEVDRGATVYFTLDD